MDAESAKAATESANLWNQIGAFIGGVLGLRGAQWAFGGRNRDIFDEIRQMRIAMEEHNKVLTELLREAVVDLEILKDRK